MMYTIVSASELRARLFSLIPILQYVFLLSLTYVRCQSLIYNAISTPFNNSICWNFRIWFYASVFYSKLFVFCLILCSFKFSFISQVEELVVFNLVKSKSNICSKSHTNPVSLNWHFEILGQHNINIACVYYEYFNSSKFWDTWLF